MCMYLNLSVKQAVVRASEVWCILHAKMYRSCTTLFVHMCADFAGETKMPPSKIWPRVQRHMYVLGDFNG